MIILRFLRPNIYILTISQPLKWRNTSVFDRFYPFEQRNTTVFKAENPFYGEKTPIFARFLCFLGRIRPYLPLQMLFPSRIRSYLPDFSVFQGEYGCIGQSKKFRLYYTSECDESQNFVVVIEDNFGNSCEMEFDFNVADDDTSVATDLLIPNGNAILMQ